MVLLPALLEVRDIPLDLPHHLLVELFPVAEEEEHLEEDEHGPGDERLVEAVQERGRAPFEHAVADELDDPSADLHDQSNLINCVQLVDMMKILLLCFCSFSLSFQAVKPKTGMSWEMRVHECRKMAPTRNAPRDPAIGSMTT